MAVGTSWPVSAWVRPGVVHMTRSGPQIDKLIPGWTNHIPRLSRDGHIPEPENSENKRCLEHFLKGKELSDGAGNRRNRKISSRRFSSLVLFISQLVLEKFLWPIKVDPFVKKWSLWNTKINEIQHILFMVEEAFRPQLLPDVKVVHA